MAIATTWLMAVMLILNAACWLFPRLNSIEGGYGFAFALADRLITANSSNIESLPLWQKLGAILLSSIPLLILSKGLLDLRALFMRYAQGDHFPESAARHAKAVGKALFLWVLVDLVCEPLLSLWLTMRSPVGQRVISVSVQPSEIVAIFLAGCVMLVARILRRASQVDAENQQFI